jgi:hypothetical protein
VSVAQLYSKEPNRKIKLFRKTQSERQREREKRCYNKYLFQSFKAGKAYISPNNGLGNIQLFYCHK